ncbi:MAG TPA: hypothetical protein VFL51_06755 [Pseudolabrys sp.]|nr:hypothetical protein [Pseudolabrys sp.]
MSGTLIIRHHRRGAKPLALFACLCAALLAGSASARAQESQHRNPPAAAGTTPDHGGFFAEVGRWFDQQFSRFNSNMQDARLQFDNFGHEADAAAKDAAGTLARLPKARVIRIHKVCEPAPNGAPDCETVAMRVCKARGYVSGKSVDMTTAEKCPARVWISGRTPAPGECTTETFVSSVLCN